MSLLRRLRPTPALFIALLALVIASAGTSYAAITVKTRNIENGAVTSAKIRDNGVKSMDIKDGTVSADDLAEGVVPDGVRWALIDATGAIEAQSGGFSVTAGYPVLADGNTLRANGNVYIDAGEDLTDNGIFAVVALQNTVDQNGDTVTNGRAPGSDLNPEFSGEIAVSICGLPGTACAPPGTGTTNHLVVSPRLSDGSPTDETNRKRFYVMVTP